MTKTNNEVSSGKTAKKFYFRLLWWPVIIGTVVCDLLGLCHLLPTHSQHLYRPYMLSMVQFKVFKG